MKTSTIVIGIVAFFTLLVIFGTIGAMNQTTPAPSTNTATPAPEPTPEPVATPAPEPTPTTDKFSGLNNPDEVKSRLDQYDANGDDKIAMLSEDSDGMEEYAQWAVEAGMSPDDASTLVAMFHKFDLNGDGFWDIQELDGFYDDYYANGG